MGRYDRQCGVWGHKCVAAVCDCANQEVENPEGLSSSQRFHSFPKHHHQQSTRSDTGSGAQFPPWH